MKSSVFLKKYKIPTTAITHPIELIRYTVPTSSGLEIGKKYRMLGNKESTKNATNPINAKAITKGESEKIDRILTVANT